jgi:hypothetical protein
LIQSFLWSKTLLIQSIHWYNPAADIIHLLIKLVVLGESGGNGGGVSHGCGFCRQDFPTQNFHKASTWRISLHGVEDECVGSGRQDAASEGPTPNHPQDVGTLQHTMCTPFSKCTSTWLSK